MCLPFLKLSQPRICKFLKWNHLMFTVFMCPNPKEHWGGKKLQLYSHTVWLLGGLKLVQFGDRDCRRGYWGMNHNPIWQTCSNTYTVCTRVDCFLRQPPHFNGLAQRKAHFSLSGQSKPSVPVLWLSYTDLFCLWLFHGPSEPFSSSWRESHERLLGFKKWCLLFLPTSIGQNWSHDPIYVSKLTWVCRFTVCPQRSGLDEYIVFSIEVNFKKEE